MTLHLDETAIKAHAEQIANQTHGRRSRKLYALAAVGTLLAGGGAAYAAMKLTGDGSVQGSAYQQQNLVISDAKFSSALYPSASVDLTFKVKNDNPFKVKLTTLGLTQGSNPTVQCAGDEAKFLSGPLGTTDPSVAIPAGDQATINGGGWVSTVTIHNAVRLSNDATKGCALTVAFTVGGESVAG